MNGLRQRLREGALLVLAAALGAGALPAAFPATAAQAAGCGVQISISSADVGVGDTTPIQISADTLGLPLAGYQLTVQFDPALAAVTGARAGPDFQNFSENLAGAPSGTIELSGASTQGLSGSSVLAIVDVTGVGAAGSAAGVYVTSASFSDTELNAPTYCAQEGIVALVGGPAVTGIAPTSGKAAGGGTVRITGGGFSGATAVDFGGVGAEFTVVNDSLITATPPAGSGLVDVTVTSPAGLSPVSAASQYTYAGASQTLALGVSPASVPAGGAAEVTAVLLDPSGQPEAGQTVRFSTSGSATLSEVTAVTDATGTASVFVTDTSAEQVSVTANATTSAGTAQGKGSVLFAAALPATGSVTAPDPTVLGPASSLPLTVTAESVSEVSATVGAGAPIALNLTTPVGQAPAVAGDITAKLIAQAQAQNLIGSSSGIEITTTASDIVSQAVIAGPIVDVETSGQAATLFDGNSAETTNPGIEITLEYEPSLLTAGQVPEVVWLDTSQSPAVWTNKGVSVLEVGNGTITALLPHLSEYTVAGVTLAARPVTSGGSGSAGGAGSSGGVGSAGGTLATADGDFALTLPAGAVPGTGTLEVSESTSAPSGLPSGLSLASHVFTMAGAELSRPEVAVVHLSDGTDARSVSLWARLAQGTWRYLPTSVDATANTASAYVSGPATLVALTSTAAFKDVPASSWSYPYIEPLLAAGLAGGFPDGSFRPAATLTRAQFVKLLVLAALGGASSAATSRFEDVAPGDWFAPYVAAAVQTGMVQGTSATTFSPEQPVTREEMATMLARALKLPAGGAARFRDSGSISSWAAASVGAVVAAGYMAGFPDGDFKPLAPTTRAQAAKVIALLVRHLAP